VDLNETKGGLGGSDIITAFSDPRQNVLDDITLIICGKIILAGS